MNSEETKALLLQGVLQGAQVNQLNILTGDNAQVSYHGASKAENGSSRASKGDENILTKEALAQAVAAVQQYMWGASSYAVLFCECRDHYGYPNVMAQFERDIESIVQEQKLEWRCKPGTLSDAFSDNPYLKLNVDKWKENGAKDRSLKLLERFKEKLP